MLHCFLQEGTALEAYTSFASVYDTFMDNVPYEEWGKYIHGMLCERGITEGIVLDLGCGTGSMTEILAGFGYDMIGVDNSEDMLELAMEKRLESGHDILYLMQDMREFELYGIFIHYVALCNITVYEVSVEHVLCFIDCLSVNIIFYCFRVEICSVVEFYAFS